MLPHNGHSHQGIRRQRLQPVSVRRYRYQGRIQLRTTQAATWLSLCHLTNYVHSKLMIVDDRFALLGSANINDRSLLGERDSELAVLIMDDDVKRADINGKGSNQPVRLFAHELRKQIWKKLFGIAGNVRPANDLQSAIDEPGNPESWRKFKRGHLKTQSYTKLRFIHPSKLCNR